MNGLQFDRFSRFIASGISRRQALGGLAAVALTGRWPRPAGAMQAQADDCEPGQTICDGVCVDTCCNNEHCGACGVACQPPLTCFEGTCDCPRGDCCAEGEVICDGACVATCCNNQHCGACGNACQPPLTCFEGTCSCPSGDCPTVTLPTTGSGHQSSAGTAVVMLLATASAAAAAVLRRSGARTEPPIEA